MEDFENASTATYYELCRCVAEKPKALTIDHIMENHMWPGNRFLGRSYFKKFASADSEEGALSRAELETLINEAVQSPSGYGFDFKRRFILFKTFPNNIGVFRSSMENDTDTNKMGLVFAGLERVFATNPPYNNTLGAIVTGFPISNVSNPYPTYHL
jgi:hypothetical protein